MQKLPYNYFKYQGTCLADSVTSLDTVLNTADDSDHGYYIFCDIFILKVVKREQNS